MFAGLICYRLVSNTAFVYSMAPSFDDPDKAMTEERAITYINVAFGVAVVSLIAMFWSMVPDRRHMFFAPKSGKKVSMIADPPLKPQLPLALVRPHHATHTTHTTSPSRSVLAGLFDV